MITKEDSLANFYHEELHKEGANKGVTLARFFADLFDVQLSKDYFIVFNRVLKVFDKEIVFMSLIDMYGIPNVTLDNIQPLLYYLCKKRFEEKTSNSMTTAYVSLDKTLEAIQKKMDKKKKIIEIRSPFDE